MPRDRLHFLFLNVGHFLDHLMMLVFATVAALALSQQWGLSYGSLITYATPGFVAFGLFSLPAGWLADHWNRHGMMAVYFVGLGLSAILTGFARTPLEIGIGLFVVGMFGAIYHPVGLSLVASEAKGMGMAIAMNGVWGNFGVGSAALITGYFIDNGGWPAAFIWPGAVSVAIGIAYTLYTWPLITAPRPATSATSQAASRPENAEMRRRLIRLSAVIFFTAAVGSIIFQSTTFALPKVFDERLRGITGSATWVGWLAFVVFGVASLAQLIVGQLLDRIGPRPVFMGVAVMQIVFFLLMPGLQNWPALIVALAFMLGAFGQIPINDYMIGRLARSELRASIYGARYVVSFVVLAAALPLIAYVHQTWGFDTLFRILACAAAAIFVAVSLLPSELPQTAQVRAAQAA